MTTTRSGSDTRAAIRRVALELFTAQGYEATSMRQIAEALDIKKASLYYHFAGKEEILRSLVEQRGAEVEELLDWIGTQPAGADLVRAAVLRWVGAHSAEKLHGIRFLAANPLLGGGGERIGAGLAALVGALTGMLPDPSPVNALRLRMALLSINAAVAASARGDFTDEQILEAARQSAGTLVDAALQTPGQAPGSRRQNRASGVFDEPSRPVQATPATNSSSAHWPL